MSTEIWYLDSNNGYYFANLQIFREWLSFAALLPVSSNFCEMVYNLLANAEIHLRHESCGTCF